MDEILFMLASTKTVSSDSAETASRAYEIDDQVTWKADDGSSQRSESWF